MKNAEFYNKLSSNYDSMIKFENSLQNKIANLKSFIQPNYKTALDLGCGTGVDSIALSKLGLKVEAVDHSNEMINIAENNSNKHNAKINFTVSNLIDINSNKKFDFIISLGNTLANLPSIDFIKVFAKTKKHISANGKVLLQIINYASLPKTGEYLLNKFEDEFFSIIRKYDIHKDHINFIIDILNKENGNRNQIKTVIYPYLFSDIKNIVNDFEFDFEVFGSLNRNVYIEEKSKDLVMLLK